MSGEFHWQSNGLCIWWAVTGFWGCIQVGPSRPGLTDLCVLWHRTAFIQGSWHGCWQPHPHCYSQHLPGCARSQKAPDSTDLPRPGLNSCVWFEAGTILFTSICLWSVMYRDVQPIYIIRFCDFSRHRNYIL